MHGSRSARPSRLSRDLFIVCVLAVALAGITPVVAGASEAGSTPADGSETDVAPMLEPTGPPEIENVTIGTDSPTVDGNTTVAVDATVTDPDGDLATVTANASAFGAGTVELTAPDVTESPNWYLGTFEVNESGAIPGEQSVSITATDETGASTERSTDPIPVAVDRCVEFDDGEVCDTDGDGNYRDVTGDGSVTNSDVTTFFSNQHTPAWNERVDRFDFDGDENVGQNDVVELFEYVTSG